MIIRCNKCGEVKIVFTTRGDRFGQHHGARCATCNNPISLKDLSFRSAILQSEEVTARRNPLPPES